MGWPFFVRREGYALVPTSRAGQLALDQMKHGVNYEITPKRRRNENQHRMFWAFMGFVAKALNDGPTKAEWTPMDVKDELLVATGRTRDRPMTRGERARHNVPEGAVAIVSRPISTSYAAMDNEAFSAFMDDAMAYVRDHLAPWITASDHWPEIEKILAASWMLRGEQKEEDQ